MCNSERKIFIIALLTGTANHYIFELKITDSLQESTYRMDNANGALEEIKSKNYAQKYQNGKYEKIYCIGLEFSETKRNLTNFSYESI